MITHSDAPSGTEIYVWYILAFFKREFTGWNVLGQEGDYGEFAQFGEDFVRYTLDDLLEGFRA